MCPSTQGVDACAKECVGISFAQHKVKVEVKTPVEANDVTGVSSHKITSLPKDNRHYTGSLASENTSLPKFSTA